MRIFLTSNISDWTLPSLRIIANDWHTANYIASLHKDIEVIGILIKEIKL